jgi:hypothetical protein
MARHVAHVKWRREINTAFWWGNVMEKNQLVRTMCREEDNIKVCLKEIGLSDWISLVQNMDIRRAVVNVVMNNSSKSTN